MGIHTASLMRSADRVHSSGVECPGCTRYLYSLSFCQVHLESVDDWFRARSQVRSSLSGFRLENLRFRDTSLINCDAAAERQIPHLGTHLKNKVLLLAVIFEF